MTSRSTLKPEWFDLSNYDVCSTWALGDWAQAVGLRSFLIQLAEDHQNHPSGDHWRHVILQHVGSNAQLPTCQEDDDENDEPAALPPRKSVAALSLEEATFIHHRFRDSLENRDCAILSEEDAKLLIKTPEDSPFANDVYDETLFKKLGYEVAAELYFTHVTVDLSAPDEILFEDFKHYVETERARLNWHSRTKRFSPRDFQDWHQNRLLPFLDLTLWARAKEVKLTNADIAEILFPDEYDVDLVSRVRRTVKPKAELLVSDAIVDALHAQEAIEQTCT